MPGFAVALGAFILLHIGVAATPLRAALVRSIGEGRYRGLFSLASAGLLAWLIWSFAAARADPANAPLWAPPAWARHVTMSFVLLAFLLAVTGLLTPGPTLAGFEKSLRKPEPARGILRVTRHPFLWGVALWGAGHLVSNPQPAAILLFGGLGVMALLGTRSIDKKSAARDPDHWAKFEGATSNIPFAAIIEGRNRLALGEMALPLLVAAAAYAGVLYAHGVAFGVRVAPFGL